MKPLVGISESGLSCNLTIFPSSFAEKMIKVVSIVIELAPSGKGDLKTKVWLNFTEILSAEIDSRLPEDVVEDDTDSTR